MADERLKVWLRQAKADLDAADVPGVQPCHQRYWLQQGCEKTIKALGLHRWRDAANDRALNSYFLNKHSPFKNLRDEANEPNAPRSLRYLLRELETDLESLDNWALIEKVDGTTPTVSSLNVSYRYPFTDTRTAKLTAPFDWAQSDWDDYQGNLQGVRAALRRFYEYVDKLRTTAERKK